MRKTKQTDPPACSGPGPAGAVSAYQRSDFSYHLPEDLIAQHPQPQRDASRLLRVCRGATEHHRFSELPELLSPGDLLVVNDTRVVKARLAAEKDSGGRAEVLLERLVSHREALCQVRVSKPLKAGRVLKAAGREIAVRGREGEFYRLRFPEPVLDFLDRHGSVPLPPYIGREAGGEDASRYQTIWNREPGAVAAPTAGLHFTEALLGRLEERGVQRVAITLHVGAGTFQPVRVENLDEHRMHMEHYRIGEDAARAIREAARSGGRIVAVGTTVVRALESAATGEHRVRPGPGQTDLFITPGYRFRVVDRLVTNFHLPESTLLMLVAAFAGYRPVMAAYREAVAAGYRFFSYGDAMLLERMAPP